MARICHRVARFRHSVAESCHSMANSCHKPRCLDPVLKYTRWTLWFGLLNAHGGAAKPNVLFIISDDLTLFDIESEFLSVRIGDTARGPLALQVLFKNGSRGRSPSRYFLESTGGMPASASAGFLRSRSEKRLARPLALQVLFRINWRDAGLGIRGVSSLQIGETARGPLALQVLFRNGSRGRSPSRFFLETTGGRPASASAGFLRSRSETRLAGRSPSRYF